MFTPLSDEPAIKSNVPILYAVAVKGPEESFIVDPGVLLPLSFTVTNTGIFFTIA